MSLRHAGSFQALKTALIKVLALVLIQERYLSSEDVSLTRCSHSLSVAPLYQAFSPLSTLIPFQYLNLKTVEQNGMHIQKIPRIIDLENQVLFFFYTSMDRGVSIDFRCYEVTITFWNPSNEQFYEYHGPL